MCLRSKILITLLTVCWFCAISIFGQPVYKKDHRGALATRFIIDPWSSDKYHFEYETSYGTFREETGYLKRDPNGRQYLVTEGSYSYVGPDDKVYRVNYRADDKGYRTTKPRLQRPQKPQKPKLSEEDELLSSIFDEPPKTEAPTTMTPVVSNFRSTGTKPEVTLANRDLPPAVLSSLLG